MSSSPYRDAEAPSPPPAPPLPPPRDGFAANAFARLSQTFSYGSQPSRAVGCRPVDHRPSQLSVQNSTRWAPMPLMRSLLLSPKVPQVPFQSTGTSTNEPDSPTSYRNTSHKTGLTIAALDISPDRTHAVLAGRDILKTIQVSDFGCAEDFNLRTNVIAYAATRETAAGAGAGAGVGAIKHKYQFAANDVKWSHGNFSASIATAAPNGQIVVYDVNRPGVEMARLHEHSRQVHRLGFSPHQGHRMLSASQDGTVRMWDLRDLTRDRSAVTCQSLERYQCNHDGIRDVKWSPSNGVEFAVGTNDGSVQRWDFRNTKAPSLSVRAHDKACYTIDWHPDGRHLVSGGGDKQIFIWDFASNNRKMKSSWSIRAPQAVYNVCWRPPCWSEDRNTPGWQCTQIAASYDQEQPQIHVWDFRRPFLPFRILDKYNSPATALLWRSESLLWSVGSAGMFTQTDINSAPRAIDQRSPNILAVSPHGKVLFFSQKRETRRPSIEDVLENLNQKHQRRASASEKSSGSHGTTQGSTEQSRSQNPILKNSHRRYPASSKSTKSLGGTPSFIGSGESLLGLEKSLDKKGIYRPSQVGGIGRVEGVFDASTFSLLARFYKIPIPVMSDDSYCDIHLQFRLIFRANAALAESVGQYRLAQTWFILAQAVVIELRARAEKASQKRLDNQVAAMTRESSPQVKGKEPVLQEAYSLTTTHNKDLSLLERDRPARTKLKPSNFLENASNVTTPLARPVPDPDSLLGTSSNADIALLRLNDSTRKQQSPKSAMTSSGLRTSGSPGSSHNDTKLSQEHINFSNAALNSEDSPLRTLHQRKSDAELANIDRQMAERRAAMGNYRFTPRPLLRLDDSTQFSEGLNIPTTGRHDSNESFHLFSASTDSGPRGQSIIGSFESSRKSERSTSTPESVYNPDRQGSYEGSNQDETALVFDGESQLNIPQAVATTPPATVNAPTTARRPVLTGEAKLIDRPIENQHSTIHFEDMEPLGVAAKTEGSSMATDFNKYIKSDFLPPEQNPDYIVPWTATAMFQNLIDYHQYKLKDAQLPAYLILHLAPYISPSVEYSRALEILNFYHDQLVSLELYSQAAELRNLCLERYSTAAAKGLYDISPGGAWCTVCQKASKIDANIKLSYCGRCRYKWAACPCCNGEGPGVLTGEGKAQATDTLWGWCQSCGHGGHNGCLRTWFSFEGCEGACPTVGCLCDCMPGTRRDEYINEARREEDKKRKTVSKDEWTVGPSAAAQKARSMVSVSGASKSPSRGVTSLAGAGRSASGGKKVRIVVPQEEVDASSATVP